MKKIYAGIAVIFLAACASPKPPPMAPAAASSAAGGMAASGAPSSAMGASGPGADAAGVVWVPIPGTDPSRAPTANPDTINILDQRTGRLNTYHGG